MNEMMPSSAVELLRQCGAGQEAAIFAAKFDIKGFAAAFDHCEQVAEYAAQLATSHHRSSDRMISMLSMCLNEALEMAFRHSSPTGALWLEVRQARATGETGSNKVVVLVSIPADEAALSAYEWCREQIAQPDAMERYRELLVHGFEQVGEKTSLVELVLVHGVELSIYIDRSMQRVTLLLQLQ